MEQARLNNDSLGGVVTCVIENVDRGLGEPVFGKMQALLSQAMMSIPGAKGFEYGMGFEGAWQKGSDVVDEYSRCSVFDNFPISNTNHSGGVNGGITNGNNIVFRVAFKPTATMPGRELNMVDALKGEIIRHSVKGRHDVCFVPRAVPVVEAMAAMVVFDLYKQNRINQL